MVSYLKEKFNEIFYIILFGYVYNSLKNFELKPLLLITFNINSVVYYSLRDS